MLLTKTEHLVHHKPEVSEIKWVWHPWHSANRETAAKASPWGQGSWNWNSVSLSPLLHSEVYVSVYVFFLSPHCLIIRSICLILFSHRRLDKSWILNFTLSDRSRWQEPFPDESFRTVRRYLTASVGQTPKCTLEANQSWRLRRSKARPHHEYGSNLESKVQLGSSHALISWTEAAQCIDSRTNAPVC